MGNVVLRQSDCAMSIGGSCRILGMEYVQRQVSERQVVQVFAVV
jgi:hypothetical protein